MASGAASSSSAPRDDEAATSVSRLFRVYRTLVRMMFDRGYDVGAQLDVTFDSFVERYGHQPIRAQLSGVYTRSRDGAKILVSFSDEPKVGVRSVEELYAAMRAHGVTRSVLVVAQGATPPAQIALRQLAAEMSVDVFCDDELRFNVTEHERVPPHSAVDADELAAVLTRYKCKASALPRLLSTDPVVRYYGWPRGTVVKVVRRSETAGAAVVYRVVV